MKQSLVVRLFFVCLFGLLVCLFYGGVIDLVCFVGVFFLLGKEA